MNILNAKFLVCLLCLAFSFVIFSPFIFSLVNGQIKKDSDNLLKSGSKPDAAMIDRFDQSIQQRFLTKPFFGMRRIEPAYPTNPHLEGFSPDNAEERASVEDFANNGWNVSLYLFGRRATPKIIDGKESKKFIIDYRINRPLKITKDLQEKDIQPGEKLLAEVKKALIEFQTPNSPQENEYSFDVGKWSYVAKPVRAANQSCLTCHTDYVVTAKLEDGKYKFRPRRIGDANGVLVYGFNKKD